MWHLRVCDTQVSDIRLLAWLCPCDGNRKARIEFPGLSSFTSLVIPAQVISAVAPVSRQLCGSDLPNILFPRPAGRGRYITRYSASAHRKISNERAGRFYETRLDGRAGAPARVPGAEEKAPPKLGTMVCPTAET